MTNEKQKSSRRTVLRVAATVVVGAVGLSRVAAAAKERALAKKGYEYVEVEGTPVDLESNAPKKTVKKKKKKAAKKKAAKKKAAKKKAAKKKTAKKKAAKKTT